MKKLVFFVMFTVFTFSAYGQQFLWSTVRDNAERYVPLDDVTREVLVFYDQYDRYYDLTGFSKNGFVKSSGYGFDDWEWLNDIENLTVFALRSNTGHGSFVLVMIISKNNVNTIVFANNPEFGFNYQLTGSYGRQKFTNWFGTLLH